MNNIKLATDCGIVQEILDIMQFSLEYTFHIVIENVVNKLIPCSGDEDVTWIYEFNNM